jgi:hypothetical protein
MGAWTLSLFCASGVHVAQFERPAQRPAQALNFAFARMALHFFARLRLCFTI